MRLPLLLLPSLLTLAGCPPTAADTARPVVADPPSENQRPPEDTAVEVEHIGDAAETGPKVFAHLPVLRIEVESPPTDHDKIAGTLTVIEDHDGTLEDLDAAPVAFESPIGLELHGSSSLDQPKQGYKLECRDADGEDTACSLLGLPAGSDWVLHAPYADKTYMRNALAYGIARAMAEPAGRWEPRTQYVELFLGGDYRGVYLLVERVSREADRLDIPKTTDPVTGAVAGGFIVKVDQHRSYGFDTAMGTPIDYATPRAAEVTLGEAAYIKAWFDETERALMSPTFSDPVDGYAAWLDVDAWVDQWLLNELTGNVDGYRLSAYLWADGPPGYGRLRAGPAWDYDRGFGNVNYCASWNTDGWVWDHINQCGWSAQIPLWWQRLRSDRAFEERLRARWVELRADVLTDEALSGRITALQAETAEAEVRDHERWRVIGTSLFPNWYVAPSWEGEVTWLEDWVLTRAEWMDAHVGE
jgi:hypothetical protein